MYAVAAKYVRYWTSPKYFGPKRNGTVQNQTKYEISALETIFAAVVNYDGKSFMKSTRGQ